MPRRSPKKPSPAPPIVTNIGSEPIQTSQGISGRIFGLLKKLPMTISATSPTKEIQFQQQQQSHYHHHHQSSSSSTNNQNNRKKDEDEEEEEYSESEDESDDESDDERNSIVQKKKKLQNNHHKQNQSKKVQGKMRKAIEDDLEDEEAEGGETDEDEDDEDVDPLGDDQCKAIMENYLLETSTRTNLLKNRTQTQFIAALRRRLNFEISRITPSIAQVRASDYHERDGGVLRRTMEYVTRLSLEQNEFKITGLKRDQSHEELALDEMEKYHRKRKRVINNFGSTSSKASTAQITNVGETDESFVMIPPSKSNQRSSNRPHSSSRSKPPTSFSKNYNNNSEDGSTSNEFNNSRLPMTPIMNDFKPARLPRRNESLISVNGSPVITTANVSQNDLPIVDPVQIFGNGNSNNKSKKSSNNDVGSNYNHHEFTFFKTSKWKELEDQLKRLEMNDNERKKIDEMLKGLKMG